jgi:hypothetical protein
MSSSQSSALELLFSWRVEGMAGRMVWIVGWGDRLSQVFDSTYSSNEASLLGSLAPSYIFSYMICPNSQILMLLSNLGFLLFIWRVVWLVNSRLEFSATLQPRMLGRIWRVVWLWIHLVVLAGSSSATDGRADLKSNLTCEFRCLIFSFTLQLLFSRGWQGGW